MFSISDEGVSQETDFGVTIYKDKTVFKVWAPTTDSMNVRLYERGDGECYIKSVIMQKDESGFFTVSVPGNLEGLYYTYLAARGDTVIEGVDPYARTTGVNGKRGMIIDLKKTNPIGFEKDKPMILDNPVDAVIYELHIRDLGKDKKSGIKMPGKFLSLTEHGTQNVEGLSTGLDHMKELGITHIHLLPIYDYASVDETKENQFNWGYDPENYNVPEGSYATNPYDGVVRITEMKQMIMELHKNGIGVIMDVVYNHTYQTDSNLNRMVPDYYYRKDGALFTNGSGCGNELATERPMVRKYIVDSIVYWATEYHLDGFRFDLMGVYDIETMCEIRKALLEVNPQILLYGEGWTGGDSSLDPQLAATKDHTSQMEGIAAFNDDIRDAIKGHVFTDTERGFVSGAAGAETKLEFGIAGAVMDEPDGDTKAWAVQPSQSVNYASAHDNLTLWDKLAISCPEEDEETRIKMNLLSAAIVITSQGIPFFQAGEEILRSKEDAKGVYHENSYNESDSINSIKWENKTKYQEVFQFYRGLIALRKEHALFRMHTSEDVKKNLTFIDGLNTNTVGYVLRDKSGSRTDNEEIVVLLNGSKQKMTYYLPQGMYGIYVEGGKAGTKPLGYVEGEVGVEPISASIFICKNATF